MRNVPARRTRKRCVMPGGHASSSSTGKARVCFACRPAKLRMRVLFRQSFEPKGDSARESAWLLEDRRIHYSEANGFGRFGRNEVSMLNESLDNIVEGIAENYKSPEVFLHEALPPFSQQGCDHRHSDGFAPPDVPPLFRRKFPRAATPVILSAIHSFVSKILSAVPAARGVAVPRRRCCV